MFQVFQVAETKGLRSFSWNTTTVPVVFQPFRGQARHDTSTRQGFLLQVPGVVSGQYLMLQSGSACLSASTSAWEALVS